MATITHVVKLDAATIQGWLLFDGGVYYTETFNIRLLVNNYNSIELRISDFNHVSVLECCFNMHSHMHYSYSHVSYMR